MTERNRVAFARLAVAAGLCLVLTSGARADYQAGVAAFERGDFTTAFDEWQDAAQAGNTEAQFALGTLYDAGKGVEQDHAQAAEWYRKAVDGGSPIAAFNLGNLYRDGRGVAQDRNRAVELYKVAAEQGHAGALNNLGVMYLNGWGVEADPKEAAKMFEGAVQRGQPRAAVNLGTMLEEGEVVRKDLLAATVLYRAAAEVGDPEARERLAAMQDKLVEALPEDAPQEAMVGQVQMLLTTLGLDPGPVDGKMGPKTRKAITDFQERVGVAADGAADRELRQQLIQVLTTLNPAQAG